MKKQIASLLMLGGLLVSSVASNASVIYDLKDPLNYNSSFGMNSVTTMGTVTLDQVTANDISILVQLAPSVFVDTGNNTNQNAFAFSLSTTQPANPFGITVSSPENAVFSVNPLLNTVNNPYGSFQYSLLCSGGSGANSCNQISTLHLSVHNDNGINYNDFIANASGYFFSADIYYAGTGKTGTIAAVGNGGGSSNNVPEPATVALLGLGLFGLATARRRK